MSNFKRHMIGTTKLALLFEVSPATVRRWVQQGCPCYKPSDRITRFIESEVREWARKQSFPPSLPQQAAPGAYTPGANPHPGPPPSETNNHEETHHG